MVVSSHNPHHHNQRYQIVDQTIQRGVLAAETPYCQLRPVCAQQGVDAGEDHKTDYKDQVVGQNRLLMY